MDVLKTLKRVALGSIFGINLFLALCLWLCGLKGNIMIGILVIVLYRLSLWLSPFAVTLIAWLPSEPKMTVGEKLLFNLALLLLCGVLFGLCYLISGNWF